MGKLFGTSDPKHVGDAPILSQQQMGLQNNVLSHLNNQFANVPDDRYDLTQNPLYQATTDNLQEILRPRTDEQLSQQFNTQIGNPAIEQYNKMTIPGLMGSFSQLGASRSSGLLQALAAAGKDLSTDLASQRQQYLTNQRTQQLQAGQAAQGAATLPLSSIMQLFSPALQQSQMPMIKPAQQGFGSQALLAAAGLGGSYLGAKGFGSGLASNLASKGGA